LLHHAADFVLLLCCLFAAGLLQGLAAACEQLAALLTQQQQQQQQSDQGQQQRQTAKVLAELCSPKQVWCLLLVWHDVVAFWPLTASGTSQLFGSPELRPIVVPACNLAAAAAAAAFCGTLTISSGAYG
jgi:uncharacterized membrane protein YgcG